MKLKKLTLIALGYLFITEQALAQGTASQSVQLENPLEADNIRELLVDILEVVIVFALPIIVFFIIYAGYLYATARGNASQIEQATRALTYAVIGGVVVLGATAIARIVGNIVTQF
jgi:hypothetical protein